ncbi:hypothetical protein A3Q56_03400 [Intoshia linei]|uniref:Pre-mRNA-processing factor 19 n=1 Tax=Intoshia linei TaxID=1819745 RepID=A0A177B3L4_9BILA|nr:hypothetical protein A3Q56_03400 [Intoshia linei]
MSLVCSISNEVPEVPVISTKSGCIFEKRLIEKFITENGTDPISGDTLLPDDLISMKVSNIVRPRPANFSSIPSILKCQQDEWDSLMLHTFSLRHQLNTTRQELTHTLYQHDAACRVIARLTKELTAVREALAVLKPQQSGLIQNESSQYGNKLRDGESMKDVVYANEISEEIGMSDELLNEIQLFSKSLTAERKKRGKSIPDHVAKPVDVRTYEILKSNSGLHSASLPGISCLDVCLKNDSRVVTGGKDKNVIVFDNKEESIISNFKGHTKKITNVIYHNNEANVVSASLDGRIKVWDIPNSSCNYTLKAHDAGVTGISMHAIENHIISSSEDGMWAFSDINIGKIVTKSKSNRKIPQYSAEFHPDGLIFGIGRKDSIIEIWDLKQNENVASFEGHTGSVISLSFSENVILVLGYYLASATHDGILKLWDLRKLKNFKSINLNKPQLDYTINDISFDKSGCYLCVAGTDLRLYSSKHWEMINSFENHSELVTSARFGLNSNRVYSVSLDRTLNLYGIDNNMKDA